MNDHAVNGTDLSEKPLLVNYHGCVINKSSVKRRANQIAEPEISSTNELKARIVVQPLAHRGSTHLSMTRVNRSGHSG